MENMSLVRTRFVVAGAGHRPAQAARFEPARARLRRAARAGCRPALDLLEGRQLLTAVHPNDVFLANQKSPPVDTTNDLILGLAPSETNYKATFEGGPIGNLTNGTAQSIVNGNPSGNLNEGSSVGTAIFDLGNGDWFATYTLDTSAHRNGYNITEIDSITGHQDGRSDQTIVLEVLPVGADPATGWVNLSSTQEDTGDDGGGVNNFSYRPGTGNGSGKMAITDDTGTLASKVSAIRFTATDEDAVFRELVVKGAPAPETAAPAAPPTLTGSAGDNAVTLTYGAAPGAATYTVKRSATAGGPYTTVASGLTALTYTDTTVTNGTPYFYVVSATNVIGEGPNSNQVAVTPQVVVPVAPTNVKAADTYQAVKVTWNAAPFATAYNVKRGAAAGGPFTTVATGVTGTSYNDASAVGGTTYFYVVSATNTAGEGPNSAASTAIVALQGAEAHYYNQQFWLGTPIVNRVFNQATDAVNGIDINWSLGPPDPGVTNVDNFSSVFTGKILAPESGSYTFVTNTQADGFLFVNGQLVSQDPGNHGQQNATNVTPITLTAGQTYHFVFLQNKRAAGGSAAHLLWLTPSNSGGTAVAVPQANLIAQSDAPSAPTALTATPSADAVKLTWTATDKSAAFNYVVERSTDNFATAGTVIGKTIVGTTTFTDTNVTPGTTYQYRVRATNFDAQGTPTAAVATATLARTTGGSISSGFFNFTGDVDLTAVGTRDWAHYGGTPDAAGSFDQKDASTEPSRVSDVTYLGDANPLATIRATTNPITATWSNGAPTGAAAATPNADAAYSSAGGGLEVSVPADTTTRVVRLYLGVTGTTGKLTARLSDGSVVPLSNTTLTNASGTSTGAYVITYKAASANQRLTLDWVNAGAAGNTGNVSLTAVTVGSTTDVFAPTISAPIQVDNRVLLQLVQTSPSQTGIAVERSSDGGGTWTPVGTVATTGANVVNFFDSTGLAVGTQYLYRARSTGASNSAYTPGTPADGSFNYQTPDPLPAFAAGFATGGDQLMTNGSASVNGSVLNITPNTASQAGSAYTRIAHELTGAWSTKFDLQFNAGAAADGLVFVLQRVSPSLIGAGGGGVGYQGNATPSVAIVFDLYNALNRTGIYFNGANAGGDDAGGFDMGASGIDLHSGRAFHVTFTYNQGTQTLHQEVVDAADATKKFTHDYAGVDLNGLLGPGAYLGFAGGTGGATAQQDVLNWTFTRANAKPTLLSSVIGDGTAQRSQVRTVTLVFDRVVSLSNAALTLARLNTGGSGANDGSAPTDASAALTNGTSSDGGVTWVYTIAPGTFTETGGSLKDGIYTATVNAAGVTGTGGTMASNATFTFHRKFGDQDGSKAVNNADYVRFRAAFGSAAGSAVYNGIYDFDGNGIINNSDYLQFRSRFGTSFTY